MSPASELHQALVEAYEPYVRGRIEELGLSAPPGLDAALEEGRLWLDRELASLLRLPFGEQRRGPLELFQEAMRFPTESLEAARSPHVRRDQAASEALPGDVFDLAPPSSSLISEEVWQAHIRWGAAKARAITSGK